MATFKEAKDLEALAEITDNDVVLGYSKAGNKYGWINVGKINSTSWAGCRWRKSDASPEGEPCGSLAKIEALPELLGLGGYLVQNDHSRRKLLASDHNYYANGQAAALDGSEGHYQWGWGQKFYYAAWEDENYEYEAIDVKPIPGHFNYLIPVGSRSCAGYATIDREEGRLVSYVNAATRYRGGNNNADLDGTYRSQLEKPATNMTIANFVTAARKNGTLWFASERVMLFITGAIKRIIFHNKNIQAAYNSALTADGLRQGGTGTGCAIATNWTDTSYWNYYPYIPLSAGVELGDAVGVFTKTITGYNDAAQDINNIPNFYGLKNDYKYLWVYEENTMLQCNSDKSQSVYVDRMVDGSVFDMSGVNNHTLVGRTPSYSEAAWNYSKKQNRDKLVMFPTEVGATEATFDCDGYYNPAATSGLRVASRLGGADFWGRSGSCCLPGNSAVSTAHANLGAALCEYTESVDTEAFMA